MGCESSQVYFYIIGAGLRSIILVCSIFLWFFLYWRGTVVAIVAHMNRAYRQEALDRNRRLRYLAQFLKVQLNQIVKPDSNL